MELTKIDVTPGEKPVKITPRDFFLHLGAMAALYTSAGSLIALLFKYIEVLFPDRLESYYDPYSSSIRFSIASLVVVFPPSKPSG